MSREALTACERLAAALGGVALDRPPCICPGGMMNMVTRDLQDIAGAHLPAAHTDSRLMARLPRASYRQGCFENCGVPFCMTVEAEALGAKVDLGGETCEPHVTEYAIGSAADWRRLRTIDGEAGRPRVVLEALGLLAGDEELAAAGVPVVGNLVGPVSVASSVLDPATLYRQMRRDGESVHELLAYVCEQLAAFGQAQVEAGADVVAIADPSASGEILGPRLFERFALPYINKVTDALHDRGVRVIVHICGQMHGVYEQLDGLRADAISFDAMVPIARARRELPGRVLMGNVSTFTIDGASSEEVARAAYRCACLGANIVAPACGLSMTSPLANVQALSEGVARGLECGFGQITGEVSSACHA